MRFPEFLYRLLDGDAGIQQLQSIWRRQSLFANQTDFTLAMYTVPQDRCLVLMNAQSSFEPPGASQILDQRITLKEVSSSVEYDVVRDVENYAAGVHKSLNWNGEVIVPPGWLVRARAIGSALANHTYTATVAGVLIPRGTITF